jgi:hypothetical protein
MTEKKEKLLLPVECDLTFPNYKEMNEYLKGIEAEWLEKRKKIVETFATYVEKK